MEFGMASSKIDCLTCLMSTMSTVSVTKCDDCVQSSAKATLDVAIRAREAVSASINAEKARLRNSRRRRQKKKNRVARDAARDAEQRARDLEFTLPFSGNSVTLNDYQITKNFLAAAEAAGFQSKCSLCHQDPIFAGDGGNLATNVNFNGQCDHCVRKDMTNYWKFVELHPSAENKGRWLSCWGPDKTNAIAGRVGTR